MTEIELDFGMNFGEEEGGKKRKDFVGDLDLRSEKEARVWGGGRREESCL